MNAGLARAIGTMMKMDFQRAVLQRIPKMERNRDQHFRPVFFLCDEYQTFATVGENEPLGDEKFFSVSRQAKCIAIVATQSISSLRSSLPGESWRTLLQTFRTKIFLALSDEFSTKIAAELCGQEDKPFINYTITESGQDAGVGLFTGKTTSEKESISASKNYSLRRDFRFTQKMFAELATAQAIVIPYDGTRALESTICYLKPYYIDPNISYFEQVRRGQL
jgi:type IV secretory pathway TraG/TraD family ATPase VirD4